MNLMYKFLLVLLVVGFLGTLSCTYSSGACPEVVKAAGIASNGTETQLSSSGLTTDVKPLDCAVGVKTSTVNITSENQIYQTYTAAPASKGNYPAVVLIHSFKGFEPGYKEMVDNMAADGYVVVAPFWQTYSGSPSDAEVEALVRNSIAYLEKRKDVDSEKLGLTGFCAGGRYTMLFLPQIKEFKSGVAWYGFPYKDGSELQPEKPASLIDQLEVPMLIMHGTRDQASNISDIYRYAGELDADDRYFELKVYQGEPHGFMITKKGELSHSFVAQDAYKEMINFFNRTLMNNSSSN
jgi:carboxymethylenebutenolidase